MKYKIKKETILIFLIFVVLSLIFSFFPKYLSTGSFTITYPIMIDILFNFVFLVIIYFGIIKLFNFLKLHKSIHLKISFKFCFFLLLILWLPILFMLFPGTLNNDTWGQLQQFMELGRGVNILSAHHPIFTSLWMSIIILPIVKIFNSWHLAFNIYVITQVILTSMSFSLFFIYSKNRLKINDISIFVVILFIGFVPLYPQSVQVIGKDSLFSWIYVLYLICIIELVISRCKSLDDRKFMYFYLSVSVLIILTKKLGIYITLITTLALLFYRKNSMQLGKIIIILVTLNFILLPVFRKILNIDESGKQEMFSLPFQQTARTVIENYDEITLDEKIVIDKVINYDQIKENYNFLFSDPIKGYDQKGEDIDYLNYIKVWINQFFKYPKSYFDATASFWSGWFSYSRYEVITSMRWHSALNPNLIPENISSKGAFFDSTSAMTWRYVVLLHKLPIVGLFLTYGFYGVILPIFALILFLSYKKNLIPVLIPIFLSFILGCLLSPVSLGIEGQRYLMPMLYSAPVIFIMMLYALKN